jgi:hypothetical protein
MGMALTLFVGFGLGWLEPDTSPHPYVAIAGMAFMGIASLVVARVTNPDRRPFVPSGLLVDLLLPPDRAEDVVNNLLGRYPYWVEKHGVLKARLVFLTQSLGTILGFWLDWVVKRANLLRLWRSS